MITWVTLVGITWISVASLSMKRSIIIPLSFCDLTLSNNVLGQQRIYTRC
jgi:hypothetical protein